MRRIIFIIISCVNAGILQSQCLSGEYATELQWDMGKKANWVNLLRMDLSVPLFGGKGSVEAATIHVAKTGESIVDDWQGFSNIEESNMFAAIAVCGYMQEWKNAHLFVGVRNVNEDFFTSEITSLFINSSCGIVPTVSASYPIANYPLSGMTLYFDAEKSGWLFRNSLCNGAGYNGWIHNDNPFLLRLKKDGIFNMSQLEYSHRGGHYLAGIAVHTRQYPIDGEGNMSDAASSLSKASCAWWIYGEQRIKRVGGKTISCIVQYSENTNRNNGCRRYGEVGCAYSDSNNQCGASWQYARYCQGSEHSFEITWKRRLNRELSIQPSFQYIANGNGKSAVLLARLYCSF